jgi:hypothetical protein
VVLGADEAAKRCLFFRREFQVKAWKEKLMRRSISILLLLFVVGELSACARPPVKAESTPGEQRSHAQGAQDELSSEIHK